jgi:CspA family cold shock protein
MLFYPVFPRRPFAQPVRAGQFFRTALRAFSGAKGFGFIQPDDGGVDVFFHVSALRDGDQITKGNAVNFEIGVNPKSGKTKAVSVDLT